MVTEDGNRGHCICIKTHITRVRGRNQDHKEMKRNNSIKNEHKHQRQVTETPPRIIEAAKDATVHDLIVPVHRLGPGTRQATDI